MALLSESASTSAVISVGVRVTSSFTLGLMREAECRLSLSVDGRNRALCLFMLEEGGGGGVNGVASPGVIFIFRGRPGAAFTIGMIPGEGTLEPADTRFDFTTNWEGRGSIPTGDAELIFNSVLTLSLVLVSVGIITLESGLFFDDD